MRLAHGLFVHVLALGRTIKLSPVAPGLVLGSQEGTTGIRGMREEIPD
jgi:hypothetical protein